MASHVYGPGGKVGVTQAVAEPPRTLVDSMRVIGEVQQGVNEQGYFRSRVPACWLHLWSDGSVTWTHQQDSKQP